MGIYVWGTGCGASELMEAGLETERIAAFVDSFPMGETFLGKPVLLPEQLPVADCDLLIITARHAKAIGDRCRELGVPEEKCLFLKNNMELKDRNEECTQAYSILGADLLKNLLPTQHIVPTPAQLADTVLQSRDLSNDYVRLGTLELLCRRLEPLPCICRISAMAVPNLASQWEKCANFTASIMLPYAVTTSAATII